MRAALFLFALASPAAATRANEREVFSCFIRADTLQICHRKGALIYNFGLTDAPELSITEPFESIAFTPWLGFVRNIYNSVVFQIGDYAYEVWSGLDRIGSPRGIEGGVNVSKDGSTVVQLECDWGSVLRELDVLSGLKSKIGQCWQRERESWGLCD